MAELKTVSLDRLTISELNERKTSIEAGDLKESTDQIQAGAITEPTARSRADWMATAVDKSTPPANRKQPTFLPQISEIFPA